MASPALEARLARLRATYLDQLPAQVEGIRRAFAALPEAGPEPEAIATLLRLVHTLKGGSGSFGLAALSRAAATGEAILKGVGAGAPRATWRLELAACLEDLDRALALVETCPPPAPAPGQPPEPVLGQPAQPVLGQSAQPVLGQSAQPVLGQSAQPVPGQSAQPVPGQSAQPVPGQSAQPVPGQEGRAIYLCEDDPGLCRALAAQLRCFGFEVAAYESLEAFRAAALRTRPRAIVMEMAYPGRPRGGAEAAAEILARHPVPLVFLTSESDLPNRLAAVRAGAGAYFVKPVNVTSLAGTLSALTREEEPEPCRVLIVDDDWALAEMNAAILQEVGMATRTVNDPLAALPHLLEFRPDLILMDMHMPGCNGMELARAIRQIDSYLSIPIVFLSSETDLDLQSDARRTGGDEFLVKPIKPGHLISAVFPRAERMRLIRTQMVMDGMTGLLNHTATKAFLDDTASRAGRDGGEFCFAMIDLDLFKKVNDTYGHPVGDRVLVALAGLLRQCLRKSDLVGRYGGEEFAVILPGCSLPQAVACLEQIRERFSQIRFDAGEGGFHSTLSCGVASFRDFPDSGRLCQAADQALYRAKHEGRNRVAVDPVERR